MKLLLDTVLAGVCSQSKNTIHFVWPWLAEPPIAKIQTAVVVRRLPLCVLKYKGASAIKIDRFISIFRKDLKYLKVLSVMGDYKIFGSLSLFPSSPQIWSSLSWSVTEIPDKIHSSTIFQKRWLLQEGLMLYLIFPNHIIQMIIFNSCIYCTFPKSKGRTLKDHSKVKFLPW